MLYIVKKKSKKHFFFLLCFNLPKRTASLPTPKSDDTSIVLRRVFKSSILSVTRSKKFFKVTIISTLTRCGVQIEFSQLTELVKTKV